MSRILREEEIRILKARLKSIVDHSDGDAESKENSTAGMAFDYIELLETVLLEIHSRFYQSWDFNEWINICYASNPDNNQNINESSLSKEFIDKMIKKHSRYIGDSYYGGDFGIANDKLELFAREIESESKKINGIH